MLALGGIALAYLLWVQDPSAAGRASARASRALHAFFVHKWYFDELIDTRRRAAVRAGSAASRATCSSASSSTACSSAAPSGAVRAGSAAVRAAQTGFLRYYAALLLLGVAGLGLYFLIAAS